VYIDRLEEAIRSIHEGNPWIDPTIASILLQQVCKESQSVATAEKTIQIKELEGEYAHIIGSAGLTHREIEILQLQYSG
jgi:two-component system, NarL family, response regulator LiaR